MGLNDTPSGERIHIGFFGCRNVGKSSLVNALTNQQISVVSDVLGTTTDPVRKAMEILPLGPVMIIDTPGFDDEGDLGKLRVKTTEKVLLTCNIAILVTEASRQLNQTEKNLISQFQSRNVPYIIVHNKSDLMDGKMDDKVYTNSLTKDGIENLKEKIATIVLKKENPHPLVGDLIKPNDIVVLVTPIDSAAPKGRMILPQQQVIRDVIDHDGSAIVTKQDQLENILKVLANKPALVITDSQVFNIVKHIVPTDVSLTSFSILMARYKGFLNEAVKGARVLSQLESGARILISEGCTHHRQCEDIGTVKLPKWIKEFTGKTFEFTFTSGTGFPDNINEYDLVIHCGGCMLQVNEVKRRMNQAIEASVPFTNYGIAIAYMNGILDRSISMLKK